MHRQVVFVCKHVVHDTAAAAVVDHILRPHIGTAPRHESIVMGIRPGMKRKATDKYGGSMRLQVAYEMKNITHIALLPPPL